MYKVQKYKILLNLMLVIQLSILSGLAQKVRITPLFDSPDRIFRKNASVTIKYRLLNEDTTDLKPIVSLRIVSDHKVFINEQNAEVFCEKKSDKKLKFKPVNLEPGFYQASIKWKIGEKTDSIQFRFGKNIEQLVSKPDKIIDLQGYWNRAKNELASIAPQFKLTLKDSLSSTTRLVYLVEMRSLENVRIRGWYSVPKNGTKFPVIIRFPGFGGSFMPTDFYNVDGFAEFLLNTRGHGNSKDDVNPGFGRPGYYGFNMANKEKYIFKGAYMDCIRAVDFVCSRPEIDAKKIVLEGGSQGGRLAFVTAALDNKRIKLCVSNIPGFCDFPTLFKLKPGLDKYMLTLTYPEDRIILEQMLNVFSYIDMKNLAEFIRCPLMLGMGLFDDEHPSRTVMSAYNNVKSKKELLIFPEAKHETPKPFLLQELEWIKHKINE